jgi:tRNA threonylcarbamoyladenosine biosynthesis protein TsaE
VLTCQAERVSEQRVAGLGGDEGLGGGGTARLDGLDGTAAFARRVAATLQSGDTILLVGELGAGKTTFVQALAKSLGATDEVVSPTFTLMRHVPLADGRTLLHLDAYRLTGPDDLEELGFFELVDDGAMAVIEWGDIVDGAFGPATLRIELSAVDDDPDARLVMWTW